MMKARSEPKQEYRSSKTITFRINSQILAKLKDHAVHDKSTLNALVNRLLLQAVNWNLTAAKSDWVPAERGVVKTILGSLGDEEIVKIAQMTGRTLPRDICLSMGMDYEVENWLEIISLSSAVSGFDLTTMSRKKEHVFVLRHDMGKKFSLHLKSFYEQAFWNLGCDASFEESENTLVFRIPRR